MGNEDEEAYRGLHLRERAAKIGMSPYCDNTCTVCVVLRIVRVVTTTSYCVLLLQVCTCTIQYCYLTTTSSPLRDERTTIIAINERRKGAYRSTVTSCQSCMLLPP